MIYSLFYSATDFMSCHNPDIFQCQRSAHNSNISFRYLRHGFTPACIYNAIHKILTCIIADTNFFTSLLVFLKQLNTHHPLLYLHLIGT